MSTSSDRPCCWKYSPQRASSCCNDLRHARQRDELAVHVLQRRAGRRADVLENLHVAEAAVRLELARADRDRR